MFKALFDWLKGPSLPVEENKPAEVKSAPKVEVVAAKAPAQEPKPKATRANKPKAEATNKGPRKKK